MRRLLAVTAVFAVAGWSADLPVRRVVLYKNGVAWVERSGELRAGEPISLTFKPEEMNDLLKSLVVESRGGAVARIRYDGAAPLTDPLAIDKEIPLAKLLDTLRGARISVNSQGKNVEGRIVSGRISPAGEKAQRQEVTLLLDGGELRLVDLDGVASLRLLEDRLQKQFDEALLAWSQSRARENKSVTIDAPGATALTARYLVPFPSWKSSYRLSLPETGEATLEGWAIVDNAGADDWRGVSLTVVSGKPVSFLSRLYEAKFITRQWAALPDEAAAAPVAHETVMNAPPPPPAPPAVAAEAKAAIGGLPSRRSVSGRSVDATEAVMLEADVAAQGQEAGELFEYRFSDPVTVGRSESVLLPFVREKLAARKLLVYSGGTHPRAAAELTNSSGKTLDGGPITVYEPGGYTGEALMPTTKQGEKRLVSYAEDLGVVVTQNFDSRQSVVRSVSAKRGVFTTRSALQTVTTYTVSNADARPKTMLVEHPVGPRRKLVSPAAAETSPNTYRFSVSLPAKGGEKLSVVEETEISNTITALSMSPDAVEFSLQNWKLTPAAQKQLEALLAKKRAIAQSDREVRQTTAELNELVKDQARIRENMTAMGRVPNQQEQVQRYSQELTRMDAAIAALRVRQNDLARQKSALENELNELAERMDF